jgi:hypothetical protein
MYTVYWEAFFYLLSEEVDTGINPSERGFVFRQHAFDPIPENVSLRWDDYVLKRSYCDAATTSARVIPLPEIVTVGSSLSLLLIRR